MCRKEGCKILQVQGGYHEMARSRCISNLPVRDRVEADLFSGVLQQYRRNQSMLGPASLPKLATHQPQLDHNCIKILVFMRHSMERLGSAPPHLCQVSTHRWSFECYKSTPEARIYSIHLPLDPTEIQQIGGNPNPPRSSLRVGIAATCRSSDLAPNHH